MINLEEKLVHYINNELQENSDAAHNLGHLKRVACMCKTIQKQEGGNIDVLLVSSYFHDIVSLPKNSPARHCSSKLAAKKALQILHTDFPSFPHHLYSAVEEAIVCHSYSANIAPGSIEAKILQDADRIDALGAIGLARVFYIAGKLEQDLFDPDDPFAKKRELNDRKFALDHFYTKLFHLPQKMNTSEGKRIAEKRADVLINYINSLSQEI